MSPTVLTALALTATLVMGCGGEESQGSAPNNAAPSTVTDPATPSAPQPPPEVQLTWLPGGGLALENVGSSPVSLAREVTLASGDEAPRPLQLGVDCAPVAAACVPLIPGAAIAFGQWPDDHGACRCPPCLATTPSGTVSLSTCDGAQIVSRPLPER